MSSGAKIFWLVTGLVVLPFGIWAGIGVKSLMNICYTVTKYEITKIGFDFIELQFVLKIKNPSYLKVGFEGYDIIVGLNGINVGEVKSMKEKILAPQEYTDITIPVKIDVKTSFKTIRSKEIITAFLAKDYTKIVVYLDGKLNGKLLGVKAPIKIKEKISLKDIIDIMESPSMPC